MNYSNYFYFLSICVFLLATFLLVTGSPLLLLEIGNAGFPFGTLITWLGVIALPLAIYFGSSKLQRPTGKTMRIFRLILLIMIVLACSWGFVSYFLAANWSFSFSNRATHFRGSPAAAWYFWRYAYLVGGLPFAFLLVFWIYKLILKWKKKAVN